MRGRVVALAGVVVLALAGGAWWLLDRQNAGDAGSETLAVPGLAARIDAIDRIEVVGAGDVSLVVLEKRDGLWRMPSRGDWPGNQREIGDALHRLGAATRVEPKTADPARHAKLGVEDVSAPTAKGAELHLAGGGAPVVLVVGNNHPALGGSYVRVGDDPQTWLIDEDVAPARDPAVWLDRRLVDLPMARLERVRVTPAQGPAFVLARVDDRFTPDGLRPAAMTDPDAGNATAGFPDQLALDDVAADDGHAATQTSVFETVDGVRLVVAAWQDERGAWARLDATLDEDVARAWFERAATAAPASDAMAPTDAPAAGGASPGTTTSDATAAAATTTSDATAPAGTSPSDATADGDLPASGTTADAAASGPATGEPGAAPDVDARIAALRTQVAAWQAKFDGRRFLLPAYKAQNLLKARADYLAGAR